MIDSSKEEEIKKVKIDTAMRNSFKLREMQQTLEVANFEKSIEIYSKIKEGYIVYQLKYNQSKQISDCQEYGTLIGTMLSSPAEFSVEQIEDFNQFLDENISSLKNEISEATEAGRGNLEKAARNAFGSKARSLN